MKYPILLFTALLGISIFANAQKAITLEDIWRDYSFLPNSVPGFNFLKDGKHYTRLERGKIQQYDLTNGNFVQTLFDAESLSGTAGFTGQIDGYTFSDDESKILIKSETESIYRHSTRAKFYVYNRKKQSLISVFDEGKQRYTTFSPMADKVAFVYENNLYWKELASGKLIQITKDGQQNAIINGGTDWVYEEEFSFHRGFQWSPDGNRIGFYRFDEAHVEQFTMTNYNDDLYPEYVTFKYPKVGADNAKVTIHIYDGTQNTTIDAAITQSDDYYIPRIKWTNNSDQLVVFRMNRHQSHLELLLTDARSGKTKLLLEERNKHYIDIHDNLTFLTRKEQFVWTSEQDGWNHIYLYDMEGKQLRQLTQGEWEVTNFYGVDEATGMVYYQAAEKSPLERQVYAVNLEGKAKQTLSGKDGWNSAQFSSTFDYFVLTHSTANSPATYGVYDRTGKLVREIEDNSGLAKLQDTHQVSAVEFFSFLTSEQVQLNGWMIKPSNFDPAKKYPVFMYVYGGPGSQQVTNSWKGFNYWWFQMLAQQGYIVACVDNRGTGARGQEFKKMTYLELGKYETIDQIEAAKYLGKLSYTDPNRIGIFGWSYGGYMSSLCILKGSDVFKAAIAVAPVTNWKWYDTIYTERYMRTEKENKSGYKDNSPVYFADQLKGSYLLVHGMGDDNVHFQHTAEMARELIRTNKQFDTYFYPNKNHGIYGGLTRLHLYTKMTDFLDANLKGPEAAPAPVAPGNKTDISPTMKEKMKKTKPKLKSTPRQSPIKE